MTELYTPPGCASLDKSNTEIQIRLGLQGFGGTGKTYSSLTFPNPIVYNIDRGLGAHTGRADVIEIPLHSAAFCKTIDPNFDPDRLKDVILTWLYKEGPKLTSNQTLVVDGNTGIQNAYHRWYRKNQRNFLTKGGQINDFAEWTEKKVFFGELMELLKTLRCHVVYICHEVDQKDKNGPMGPSYSGKIRPLLTGAFGDEILTHFTDWFRQMSRAKVDPNTIGDDVLKLWRMTKDEFRKMQDSFTGNAIYYWRTESDDIFDAKCSSLVNAPTLVPATYESFVKYRRKIS